MNYIDLGECVMTRVDNTVSVEDIFTGIHKVIEHTGINEKKFVNIIAVDEMAVYLLSDFIKSIDNNVQISVSIMKNYNIIPLSGKLNYHADMFVLHDGVNLNVNDMMLRIFSTMSYRFTNPTYITLFDHQDSHYPILYKECESYTGYGKMDKNNTTNYWSIEYK